MAAPADVDRMSAPGRKKPHAEDGFALIEVLVSGLIAVIVAGGVMAVLQTSVRSAADSRKRAQAYAVAQEDQARMRAMRVPSLYKYSQTRTVTVDGVAYTVESSAKYINNSTGDDLTCASGSSSVDFVKITSKVTWTGMRPGETTTIQGLVAPPNGTLNPSAGTLVFMTANAAGSPISGIGLSGSGAGTFSGTTNSSGCAIFLEQASGEYTLTLTGFGTGLVDQDGITPGTKKIKVSPEVTNTVNLLFDKPGKVPLTFKTRSYSGSIVANKTDSFLAFNTGMSTAKLFGAPEGARFTEKTAEPLFPFTSKDSFYAGSCTSNNPETGAGIVSVNVPAGGTAATQTIQMPPLYLNVIRENIKNNGTKELIAYNGAEVVIKDNNCEISGHEVKRTFTTETVNGTAGRLGEPGLPWSKYTVCVSLPATNGGTTATYHETVEGIGVENVNGTNLEMTVSPNDPTGKCP
jgi:Tfp pilus assembly protein PilV